MQEPFATSKGAWPPNYIEVFAWRQRQYELLKNDPELIYGALEYYRDHPAEFIAHWCDTYDPRNASHDMPTRLPLVMFPRQIEMVDFLVECLEAQESGLIDKSRDTGATWVCASFSLWAWRFRPGSSIGWGSRKADLVDKLGDPDSIFEKMRLSLRGWPRFFWPEGFHPERDVKYMTILNPENEASITGEAGKNIGRGGRKLMYFKDESAHYEQPEKIEAALMDNTRVQIDISTPHGIGTVFDRKREAGTHWSPGKTEYPRGSTRVFVLDWSDHPAKTRQWYEAREKAARDQGLLHIFRQEVDRDAASSLVGVLIPPEWVRSAVDAHIELGLDDDGAWSAALDVADEGGDLNALTIRKGIVLRYTEDWGDGDTGDTTRRTVAALEGHGPIALQYDCIGVGAGVKAEANRLMKENLVPRTLTFVPWNAGAAVLRPEERVIPGDKTSLKNKDFYANLKAQAAWALRRRFEKTHRMRTEPGVVYPADELISLDSKLPNLAQIKRELSQSTVTRDGKLRLMIDKRPDGARSPNNADSIVMNYFPAQSSLVIPQSVVKRSAMGPRR